MIKCYNSNSDGSDQFIVKEKELEVQFISATRHDTKSDRSLCRGEMLELMVRVAHIKKRQAKERLRKGSITTQSQGKQNILNMLQSTLTMTSKKSQEGNAADTDNNTYEYLETLIFQGIAPFCDEGPILTGRRYVQDDPLVVKELALRLKELKVMFEHFTVRGLFKFESSALRLFEMQDLTVQSVTEPNHFWYPLNPQELWIDFVHSMMTVLNEI